MDVDAEDPLILVRDEAGWEDLCKEAGSDPHDSNHNDGDDPMTNQQLRRVHVAFGGNIKNLIEASEECAKRPAHGTWHLKEHGTERGCQR